MPNANYYRKQARILAHVAAQCSTVSLAGYYTRMARDYLARAVQLEAELAKRDKVDGATSGSTATGQDSGTDQAAD